MADLASLGLAVDSSPIDAANKALENFSQSGKNAQLSADVLVASAVRLGISVEEVQRRLDAANDNLAATTEQAMKLSDATKMASAANDNFSNSIGAAGAATVEAGRGFFGTVEHVLNLTNHLKLLALGAYALSPAFRGFVNAGLSKIFLDIIPSSALAQQAMAGLASVGGAALSVFARITPPILTAVVAFQAIEAVWTKGSALLDKYANSLRALYSDDVVQNLQKLTKGQGEAGEIISAEQIARATELGVRLQDAGFIINKFLTTSIIDLTGVSLKLQTVWVNFVETVARGAQILQGLPLGLLAKVAISAVPGGQVAVAGASVASRLLPADDETKSLDAARDRLSAMMGVAALAAEGVNKTNKAVGDLDKELDIGSSFIARYSDNIKKLADGVSNTDSWDRVSNSIDRTTARLSANAASVGESIKFQESLRVETQLLTATKGGLNAATDDQIDKFVELRVKGVEPLDALTQAGITLDAKRAKSLKEMGEAAGTAKSEFEQANFAIANQKALDSDKLALQSLTAYSAAQKGAVAEAQKRLSLEAELRRTEEGSAERAVVQAQIDAQAASAKNIAIATEIKQLTEAARARALSADQTTKNAQLSLDVLGKSSNETARLTAIEQTRQQLEQDASARHTVINQKELADLTAKINKTYELKGVEAQESAQRNADFSIQTGLLSSVDQQIASIQKGLHGDAWKDFMNDGLSAAIRVGDALRSLGSTIESSVTPALRDMFNGTTKVSDGFKNLGLTIVKALEDAIIKLTIVQPLINAMSSSLNSSGILGFLGLGGATGALNANGSIVGAVGATSVGGAPLVGLHGGGIVGSEATFNRVADLSLWNNAQRFHGGGIVGGEVPIIAKKGEGVFTEGQMAAMGGGGVNVTYAPVYQLTGTSEEIEKIKAAAANDRAEFSSKVVETIKRAQKGRQL